MFHSSKKAENFSHLGEMMMICGLHCPCNLHWLIKATRREKTYFLLNPLRTATQRIKEIRENEHLAAIEYSEIIIIIN